MAVPVPVAAVQVNFKEVALTTDVAKLVGALGTAFGVPYIVVEAADVPYTFTAFM